MWRLRRLGGRLALGRARSRGRLPPPGASGIVAWCLPGLWVDACVCSPFWQGSVRDSVPNEGRPGYSTAFNAAHFRGRKQAAPSSREDELSSKSWPLSFLADSQTRQTESRHGATGQPAFPEIGMEGVPIVPFADRLLLPCRNAHFRFGSAFAAANSFAFGTGGFSSRWSTRRLSRAESLTRSAS